MFRRTGFGLVFTALVAGLKAAPIKAVARLTTISPTGQTTAVSHAITIAAVGKHH